MKQLKRSYTRSARLLFAALLLLMVAGSVYDFQISSFLYPGKESSFGQFFAAFGELPAFLALICAAAVPPSRLSEKGLEHSVLAGLRGPDPWRDFSRGP